MSKVFAVEVRRRKTCIYKHSISAVTIPTTSGRTTIMAGHHSAEFHLATGTVKLVSYDGRILCLPVDGGRALVARNGVVVESSKILLPQEIDVEKATRDYDYTTSILIAPETPATKLRATKHRQQWSLAQIEALRNSVETPQVRTKAIRLTEYLSENLIATGLVAKDKWDAIEQQVEMLVAAGRLAAKVKTKAVESIVSREKMMSTAIGGRIAIPHGSCKKAPSVAVCMGIYKQSIDFSALDDQPVDIVILAAVKPATFNLYVRTLGGVARIFRDGQLHKEITSCRSPAEILEQIHAAEERIWLL